LLRNIAECTRINGFYIVTCYDGQTVFQLLKGINNEEGITIMKEGRKIYEIIKMYDQTGFPDEDMSLGYSINVFQESINQYFREYLVHFDYFTRIMEDYGFILAKNESRGMNLPDATGMFSELFNIMEIEIKQKPYRQSEYRKAMFMSPEERRISFMNRYFVFKKVRSVDAKKMAEVILKEQGLQDRNAEENLEEVSKMVFDEEAENKTIEKKKRRLVIRKNNKKTDITFEEVVEKTEEKVEEKPQEKIRIKVKR
jgi:hypothetical protein